MYTFTIPRDEFDELRPDKQMMWYKEIQICGNFGFAYQ